MSETCKGELETVVVCQQMVPKGLENGFGCSRIGRPTVISKKRKFSTVGTRIQINVSAIIAAIIVFVGRF